MSPCCKVALRLIGIAWKDTVKEAVESCGRFGIGMKDDKYSLSESKDFSKSRCKRDETDVIKCIRQLENFVVFTTNQKTNFSLDPCSIPPYITDFIIDTQKRK